MRFSAFVAAALLALSGVPASAAPSARAGEVPLFAGGGTPLTNGAFFPGTAVYDGSKFQGQALQVPQGSNVQFVNLDYAPLTNGHKVVSFKYNKKTGKPFFTSPMVNGPGQALMVTSKLKPGVYPFFCSVHSGMFGLLEITQ
jgi:plastocyanin